MGGSSVPIESMQALVGRRFPGGSYAVEHWENVLLHDVVVADLGPDGIVHPIGLFHVPLAACGWTYSEIFTMCQAESDEAVRAGEYTWQLVEPMREGRCYDVTGEFLGIERKHGRAGAFDKVTFRLDLTDRDAGTVTAHVTNSWLFLRSDVDPKPAERPPAAPVAGERNERRIPEWRLDAVTPERMKLLAAILRDPNPIHWDRAEVAARGLGDRLINQGPTNVGYVCNALAAWAGPTALRSLTVRFTSNVFDGDTVVAGGVVTAIDDTGPRRLAACDVWLDRGDGTRAITGHAVVAVGNRALDLDHDENGGLTWTTTPPATSNDSRTASTSPS